MNDKNTRRTRLRALTDETFELQHRPHAIRQVETCVDPGDHHAPHRRLTEKVCYVCNCGYSSGWVHADSLPLASDFIEQHMPSEGHMEFERTLTRMELGCTCDE